MRRFFSFLVLAVTVCSSAFGQSADILFEYHKDGHFFAMDGKSYVVREYEGLSAHELYSIVLANFDVLSKEDDTLIKNEDDKTLSMNLSRRYLCKLRTEPIVVDIVLEFQFKDGRMRIMAPDITRFYNLSLLSMNRSFNDIIRILDRRDVFDKDDDSYKIFNGAVSEIIEEMVASAPETDEW